MFIASIYKLDVILLLLFCFFGVGAKTQVLDNTMHYVSNTDNAEWEEFQGRSKIKELIIEFSAEENSVEYSLGLKQYDVKQSWQVAINDNKLGVLVTDMNAMNILLPIPTKTLRSGKNRLRIYPLSKVGDDILVGEVVLYQRAKEDLLRESGVNLEVVNKKSGDSIPCRITITNNKGVLQTVAATSSAPIAVRTGTVYSLNGKVSLGLPAGEYTIYATRGFEYGVDSIRLSTRRGERVQRKLAIAHEVPMEGWISSDTHIHTYTHSGHGDASIEERALSIAGEAIELPVLTEHNKKVDLTSAVKAVGAGQFYTPVNGMEFTTNLGHFNTFPVNTATAVPNNQLKNWNEIPALLNPDGNSIVILNHARDVHNGFIPFGPTRHISSAGAGLDSMHFPATAMEIFNSGSLQTNFFQLFHDWMGMLNRGHFITPVGSSDSHDVSRYIIGQARTYIRSSTDKATEINTDEVFKNFKEGRVGVSMGLATQITVNNKYSAGDLALTTKEVSVTVTVLGPSWVSANLISLYANGKKIREAVITPAVTAGIKWKGNWMLPKFANDVCLVAIAEGPYHHLPYWPLVKPFQPLSPKWTPAVAGVSGAVWIDSDGDGKRSSAHDYARQAWESAKGNLTTFIKILSPFDEAVAVQAASLLQKQELLTEANLKIILSMASSDTKKGFQRFLEEWNAIQRKGK